MPFSTFMRKLPCIPGWLLIVGLIGLGLVLTESKDRRVRSGNELLRMSTQTETLAKEVSAFVTQACAELLAISQNPALISPSSTQEQRLSAMRQLGQDHQFMTELSLLDAKGYIIATTCFLPISQDCTTWFTAARNGRFTISRPVVAADGIQLTYAVYMPVNPAAQSDVAVIRATMPFDQLSRLVRAWGDRIGGRFLMTDSFGNILAGCDSARELEPFSIRLPLRTMGEQGFWKSGTDKYRFVSRPVEPAGLLPGEALRLLWLKPEA